MEIRENFRPLRRVYDNIRDSLDSSRAVKIGAVVSALALTSCGSSEMMTEGNITGKIHEPESTWASTMPVPIMNCNAQFCSTSIIIMPYIETDDEDWIFTLKDCKTNTENNKEECKTGAAYVTKQVYDSYKVGDRYKIASRGEFSDPNYVR